MLMDAHLNAESNGMKNREEGIKSIHQQFQLFPGKVLLFLKKEEFYLKEKIKRLPEAERKESFHNKWLVHTHTDPHVTNICTHRYDKR